MIFQKINIFTDCNSRIGRMILIDKYFPLSYVLTNKRV